MLYRLTADAVVILHLSFIVFVVCGGFLAWRWPRLIWVHLPAAAWGTAIELFHWTCPLTPLEKWLRERRLRRRLHRALSDPHHLPGSTHQMAAGRAGNRGSSPQRHRVRGILQTPTYGKPLDCKTLPIQPWLT